VTNYQCVWWSNIFKFKNKTVCRVWEEKIMIDRARKQKDRKKTLKVNKTYFVTVSANLLANLVKGCAPPQQYFPKDTVLALGMTLLELQYILH